MFLTELYHYHHDLFFANIGDTAITDLKVELLPADGESEPSGVVLDDYWTLQESSVVGSFDSTNDSTYYSYYDDPKMSNIGKVRLLPKTDDEVKVVSEAISGKLVQNNYEDADGVKRYSMQVVANGLELLPNNRAEEKDEPKKNGKYHR